MVKILERLLLTNKKNNFMNNECLDSNNTNQENNALVKKAKRRVGMKIHFTIFLLTNILFWLLYFFLFKDSNLAQSTCKFFLATTLIWSIFVYAHYLIVFKWGKYYIDKEIKHLQKKRNR